MGAVLPAVISAALPESLDRGGVFLAAVLLPAAIGAAHGAALADKPRLADGTAVEPKAADLYALQIARNPPVVSVSFGAGVELRPPCYQPLT